METNTLPKPTKNRKASTKMTEDQSEKLLGRVKEPVDIPSIPVSAGTEAWFARNLEKFLFKDYKFRREGSADIKFIKYKKSKFGFQVAQSWNQLLGTYTTEYPLNKEEGVNKFFDLFSTLNRGPRMSMVNLFKMENLTLYIQEVKGKAVGFQIGSWSNGTFYGVSVSF